MARKKVRRVGFNSSYGTVKVKGEPKFPVNTKGRARAALARLNQGKGLSVGQKRHVMSQAYKRLGVKPKDRTMTVTSSGRVARKRKR